MKLVAIVLTFNEELHLARCLDSLKDLATDLVVVDSSSTDSTREIAHLYGAQVWEHEFVNQAQQFNWALSQLDSDVDWVFRLDADEVVTPALAAEIKERLPFVAPETDGLLLNRYMTFQSRLIRHGGVFPSPVLRLFRYGRGRCEDRWMDEHIKVAGVTAKLQGAIIDDNLQSLTWWIAKHNSYASREAVDLLNLEYGFMPHDTVANLRKGEHAGGKRWVKERIYVRLPVGFRAFAYFFYRYVIRLGFLDGREGTAFHFLQGFWYRYLVDVKVAELKRYMRHNDVDVQTAIRDVLRINL